MAIEFAKVLKKLRTEKGLSQRELADASSAEVTPFMPFLELLLFTTSQEVVFVISSVTLTGLCLDPVLSAYPFHFIVHQDTIDPYPL